VLVGIIPLSTCLKRKLKKYKMALGRLADKRVTFCQEETFNTERRIFATAANFNSPDRG